MSRSQLVDYARPSTLDEAHTLLRTRGKSARIIGGGIDLARFLPADVTTLIDISKLDLSYVEERSAGIAVGATTTFAQLLEDRVITQICGGVVEQTLRKVGSPLLRNLATVGGSVVSAHPWSDVITLFIALDAKVVLYNGETQTVPLTKLYASRSLLAGSIVHEVIIPIPSAGFVASFYKFSRTEFDIALINCACVAKTESGKCTTARIAIGGTPYLATRLTGAEKTLTGSPLSDETIEKVARILQETTVVADDRRASANYRKQLIYAIAKRCLQEIKEKSEGGR